MNYFWLIFDEIDQCVGKSAYFKGGSFLRLLFTLHCLLLVSVASLSWSPGEARNAQCYQNLLILFGHVFLNSSHFSATEISCHAVVVVCRILTIMWMQQRL